MDWALRTGGKMGEDEGEEMNSLMELGLLLGMRVGDLGTEFQGFL